MSNLLIDYLRFRAIAQGDQAALIGIKQSLTFAQLYALVKRAALKLHQVGILPGDRVCILITNKRIDWILTLALTHEAAITCSRQISHATSEKFDWYLTTDGNLVAKYPKGILIDSEWFNEAKKLPLHHPISQYPDSESAMRMIFTSGSTGESKGVDISQSSAISRSLYSQNLLSSQKAITLMGLGSSPGFLAGLNSLLSGHALYCAQNANETAQLVQEHQLMDIYGSPMQLLDLLKYLEKEQIGLPSIQLVRYGGASASRSLLSKIESKLTPNVINMYGASEVGLIGFLPNPQRYPDGATGFIAPIAKVQSVSNEGIAQLGVEGAIRIKTPHMVRSYFNNTEASKACFKDGWFYPGDRGVIRGDGLIILSGRSDDLLNISGAKINLAAVDEFLSNFDGLQDGAAFSIVGDQGEIKLGVAIVVQPNFDIQILREALHQKFGPVMSAHYTFKTKTIPRNPENNKVLRKNLAQIFQSFVVKRA